MHIDGVDISAVNVDSLRGQMAMVTQDAMMLRGTIAENVDFGRGASLDQINAAITIAEADFVHALPDGLKTIVAEGGASLSGGQRQRLAIARAVLRDPAILILDEATSALDSESEEKIQQALSKLVIGKTVLIIAHRFSTIVSAQQILVFENGRIIDCGPHEELLERCQLYKRLYQRQL